MKNCDNCGCNVSDGCSLCEDCAIGASIELEEGAICSACGQPLCSQCGCCANPSCERVCCPNVKYDRYREKLSRDLQRLKERIDKI